MHIYNVQCSVVNRKLENLKYLTESREQWNYKATTHDNTYKWLLIISFQSN